MKDIVKNILRIVCISLLVWGLLSIAARLDRPDPMAQGSDVSILKTQKETITLVLKNRDYCVVSDCGEGEDLDALMALLQDNGVTEIDCLVVTHPTGELLRGAADLFSRIKVSQVVHPYYKADDENYKLFSDAIKEFGVQELVPANKRILIFGEIRMTVYPPFAYSYGEKGNYSLLTLYDFGNISMMDIGAPKNKRISEISELSFNPIDYLLMPASLDEEAQTAVLNALNPYSVVRAADLPVSVHFR